MERETRVFLELGADTLPVGRLWSQVRKGRERIAFEYERSWLQHPGRFALEPALQLGQGPHHSGPTLFGSLGDSAPDRWGRTLMRRAERLRARAEGRETRTLFEVDYLLGVDDQARLGALRFKDAQDGPFLASAASRRIPPLLRLPQLLTASWRVLRDQENEEDLRLLLAPGSSLGGARPKASVRDEDGHLAMAKFPAPDQDEFDIVRWEAVALALAARAGVRVPRFRLLEVAASPVLLSRRFDRVEGGRVPFLSAKSMLNAQEHETRSYLDLADALLQHGARPEEDLRELWRRIVFNVLTSNTDDHLRNHGFLHEAGLGWGLSPAYDLNPVPEEVRPRVLSTAIDTHDTTASLKVAFGVAAYFRLEPLRAREIAREVGLAVKTWRSEAARQGLKSAEIRRMRSAFEHRDLELACG